MKKIYFVMGFLLVVIQTINLVATEDIVWKYGIAFISGKPCYIDYSKLDQSAMTVSKNWIKRCKNKKMEYIQPGRLSWATKTLTTYDTKVDNPYGYLFESKIIYSYKVNENKMYISKDNKNWENLSIEMGEVQSAPINDRLTVPVFMIIYLKCKWFEGEFELIGTTG